MPHIVRLGDTSTHGGTVTSASPDVRAEGKFVARLGDTFLCPAHGARVIASASAGRRANGRGIARHGDSDSCGATLISGATTTSAA